MTRTLPVEDVAGRGHRRTRTSPDEDVAGQGRCRTRMLPDKGTLLCPRGRTADVLLRRQTRASFLARGGGRGTSSSLAGQGEGRMHPEEGGRPKDIPMRNKDGRVLRRRTSHRGGGAADEEPPMRSRRGSEQGRRRTRAPSCARGEGQRTSSSAAGQGHAPFPEEEDGGHLRPSPNEEEDGRVLGRTAAPTR